MLTIFAVALTAFAALVVSLAIDLHHRARMDSLHLKYARQLAAVRARGVRSS